MQTAPAESDDTATRTARSNSLGEILIPFLLLIGETCVGYAVLLALAVSLNFIGDTAPLVPFGGLLLTLLTFYLLTRFFRRWSRLWVRMIIEPGLWLILSVVFALYFTWANNYASTPLFPLTWLLQLLHLFIPASADDSVQVNVLPALQAAVLLILSGLYCWRGYRLAHKHLITDDIDRLFKVGTAALLIAVAVFVISFNVQPVLVPPADLAWACAVFFVCVPIARALTHASYLRRFHRAGLWGSASRQESSIWFAMSILGLLMIVLVATTLMIFLGEPLPQAPYAPLKKKPAPPPPPLPGAKGKGHFVIVPNHLGLLLFLVGVVPIAIAVIIFFVIRYRKLLRARKAAKLKKDETENENESDELRESFFRWSLLWDQLKALVLGLLASLLRRKRGGANGAQREIDDILLAEPAVRNIRAIYRALLKRAANMGYTRTKDETPYEFRERLHASEPAIAPEVELITEAYVQARYSGKQPGEADISRVRALWVALRDKWARPIPTQQGR